MQTLGLSPVYFDESDLRITADELYWRLASDPVVAPLIARLEPARVREHVRGILTQVIGRAQPYTGWRLRQAGKALGLERRHLQAAGRQLFQTLVNARMGSNSQRAAAKNVEQISEAVLKSDFQFKLVGSLQIDEKQKILV